MHQRGFQSVPVSQHPGCGAGPPGHRPESDGVRGQLGGDACIVGLGVDPFQLPSAVLAGASSLVAFSLGALLPYLAGFSSLVAALAVAVVALVVGGMVVGRITGRPVLRSGLRQLALGALAVA
jgi:VIT1/CCC1 family predicted Fe2+/Mn2+ transporter